MRAARLPVAGLALTFALLAGGFAVLPSSSYVWIVTIAVPYALVGSLIAWRVPRNPIGWLFLGFGIAAAIDFAAYHYASETLVADPGSLPGGDIAAAVAVHIWHASWGLYLYAFLVFPDGRLVSPRWRWAARGVVIVYGGLLLSGPFDTSFYSQVAPELRGARPLFGGTIADVGTAVFSVLLITNLAMLLVATTSLVLRFRRSSGVERLQLKWFVYTVVGVLVMFLLLFPVFSAAVGVLLFPLIPMSAAVAVLKYRLYDIDVVVNRTLVYGALTVILGATYLASVLVLEFALTPVTSESDLGIAASTLVVAALFRPVRSRVQALVDRRFYRRRYDARQTVDAFAARLRDEVDIHALGDELAAVAAATMQPAHVAVWLRER